MARRVTSRDLANACALLGIAPTATADEAKQAYRDLAKVWHPDRFESDRRLQQRASEKLKQLNAAHAVVQQALTQGVDLAPVRQDIAKPSKGRTWIALLVFAALGTIMVVGLLHLGRTLMKPVKQAAPAPQKEAPLVAVPPPASQPVELKVTASSLPVTRPKLRKISDLRAGSLLDLYALVLKNADAHVGELACGPGFLFNAEEKNKVSTFQIWLMKGKRILFEKNVFFTMEGTALRCVQDVSVQVCGRAAGSKHYRTRQGETQTVPYFSVEAITCSGVLYQPN